MSDEKKVEIISLIYHVFVLYAYVCVNECVRVC